MEDEDEDKLSCSFDNFIWTGPDDRKLKLGQAHLT